MTGREIKFRIWNDLTMEMYYSHRPDGSNNPLWGWDAVFTDHINMASTHLMQFTGLKDKNGVEIYEEDIVRYVQKENFNEDVYNRIMAVKFNGCGYTPFIWHYECEDGYYSVIIEDVEIVGNIYEQDVE